MYYIRTWYKDPKGNIFHHDREYPEIMETMECVPYRVEIIDEISIIYRIEIRKDYIENTILRLMKLNKKEFR